MKRLIALLLILTLLTSLVACSEGTGDKTTEITGTTTSTATTKISEPTTVTDTTAAQTTAETAAPEATAETITIPTHVTGVDNGYLTMGNLRFEIPQGFQPFMVNEQTYLLHSEDTECYFGVFFNDISALTKEKLLDYLTMQRGIFLTDDAVQFEETIIDGYVAGCDVPINYYGEMDADLNITSNMEMIFADSQYSYTILFICDAENDKLTDFIKMFAEFTAFAEHLLGESQFTFVH